MSLEQLLNLVAYGRMDADVLAALADALDDLLSRLPAATRAELDRLSPGVLLGSVPARLRASIDLAIQTREARRINELPAEAAPDDGQLAEAAEYLMMEATAPLASRPLLRDRLVQLQAGG